MGDDIGLGSVCFDFAVVQLSAAQYVVCGRLMTIDDSLSLNPNRCHNPLITYLRMLWRMPTSEFLLKKILTV